MLTLNAHLRDHKKANVLRAENLIPAELYGSEIKNQSLAVNYNEFVKVYNEAGESTLLDLKTPDGKTIPILIGETAAHPISGRYSHIDLRQVKLTEKIEAEVELKFIGEAPATSAGGVFIVNKSVLMIKGLPRDLVSELEVDISHLLDIDDKILVKDIKPGAGLEIIDDPRLIIASIARPMEEEKPQLTPQEEEAAAIAAQSEAAAKAKEEKEKKETAEEK